MTFAGLKWLPAIVLGVGAFGTVGIDTQRTMSLTAPLEQGVPDTIAGFAATDLELSDAERRAAGVTAYLLREYTTGDSLLTAGGFSLYVGYYDRQTEGHTIHSPRNCLPGAGWEALTSREVEVQTANGPVRANQYLLQKGEQRALVLYWYQGRGRVAANEYEVKWDLLRDAALRRRTEEALVRVVVPVLDEERGALALARNVAATVIPSLSEVLPS